MEPAAHVRAEIASQPQCWERALEVAQEAQPLLPAKGERVAAIGCGTSWFMAASYASLREEAGLGETDAFAGSEFPGDREYDRLVVITRSGTTTEILRLLDDYRGRTPTTAIIADPDTPALELADETIVLDFADEQSVVQTRFATTALSLLRAHLGENLEQAIADARRTVFEPLNPRALTSRQFTFLGTGWTVGLATEGALKMREASLSWTESYPIMEYRHGPKSITDEQSTVWFLTAPEDGLETEVEAMGGNVVLPNADPLAELIKIQRLAVDIGVGKGLNPDLPRNLSRSVILDADD
ncbi:MAG: sugar isomerase [Actinobacteria bacterium]|nr:sugar isomerase [Actinomycetota bacterium]